MLLNTPTQYSRRQWLCLLGSTGLAATSGVLIPSVVMAADPPTMAVDEVRAAVQEKKMILIDIRRPEELKASGIPDVAIPMDWRQKGFADDLLALRKTNPDVQLGLICATGERSRMVTAFLLRKGVTGVIDVAAGTHGRDGWLEKQLPIKQPTDVNTK